MESTERICSFEACQRIHHAHSYCAQHLRQKLAGRPLVPIKARLTPGTPLDVRIADQTDRSGDCWEWQGWKRAGYGMIYSDGAKRTVHRLAYELENGPIAEGLEIDHKCRNRGCVRVSHLQAVPRHVNAQNLSAQRNNRTGFRGVFLHRSRTGEVRYGARATANGKHYSGGHYRTAEEANEAAIRLRNRVHVNNREDWDE